MADAQTIKLVLELQDKMSAGLGGTNAALAKANAGMDSLGGSLDKLKGGLSAVGLGGATAFLGVGTAIAATVAKLSEMTTTGIELNKTFESTTTRIAGTLSAFKVAPTFQDAKAMATDVMGTIANLAAALPGETEDYVNVFATALPKALAAGLTDMQEVAKFTSYWTAVASSNMVDANQAGMDLFRMLSGQAGADVRMFTVLAEVIGMTAETFNKLSAPDRLATIQGALGRFKDQLGDSGSGFESIEGSLISMEKEIQRLGTSRVFEQQKEHIERMNKLLTENKDLLIATSNTWTEMWGTVKSKAEEFWTIEKLSWAWLNEEAGRALEKFSDYLAGRKGGVYETPSERYARERAEKEDADREAAAGRRIIAEHEASVARSEERLARFEQIGGADIARRLGTPSGNLLALGTGILTPADVNKLLPQAKAADKAHNTDLFNRLVDFVEYFRGESEAEIFWSKATGINLDAAKNEAERKKREKAKGHQTNFYNARFDIKQNFAEGFDPDRIAVAFVQDLARAGELRTQANSPRGGTVR